MYGVGWFMANEKRGRERESERERREEGLSSWK